VDPTTSEVTEENTNTTITANITVPTTLIVITTTPAPETAPTFKATSVTDPVDSVETSKPPLQPIIIDGQFETNFDWDKELSDKGSDSYKEKRNTLENDLKIIFEDDEDIETAELTECTFTEVETQIEAETIARKRRQASTVSSKAQAEFTVKVTAQSIDVAKEAAIKTITNADPETFSSLSAYSANSYSQVVTDFDQTSVTVSAMTTGIMPYASEVTTDEVPVKFSETTMATQNQLRKRRELCLTRLMTLQAQLLKNFLLPQWPFRIQRK